MTTRLPVLDELRIATPCNADWDDMAGNERVRFCGKCEKNVYNFSAMTRLEAEALVREREGRLCVRLFRRADGTVLSSDCPVAVRRQRLRQRVWASVSGAVASAMLLFTFGRARADLTLRDGKKPRPPVIKMMGAVVAMPSPPPLMGKMVVEPPEPQLGGAEMGDVAAPRPKSAPKR